MRAQTCNYRIRLRDIERMRVKAGLKQRGVDSTISDTSFVSYVSIECFGAKGDTQWSVVDTAVTDRCYHWNVFRPLGSQMNSLDGLVKDRRSLVFEVLFSLDGFVGDLVALKTNRGIDGTDGLQLSSSAVVHSIGSPEINFLNRLIVIASLHHRITGFVQKYSSGIKSHL